MRKLKKAGRFLRRVSLVCLSVILLLSVLPLSALELQSKQVLPGYPAFQAEKYAETLSDIFSNPENSYANIYYTQMKSDKDLMKKIDYWEQIHVVSDPSYVLESCLQKKDLYTLALFDVFSETTEESILSKLLNIFVNEQNGFIVSMIDQIVGNDISAAELKTLKLTDELKTAVLDSAKHADMASIADMSLTILSAAGSVIEGIEMCARYEALSRMKSGMQSILRAIYEDTNNSGALRSAAYDCISAFGSAFDKILVDANAVTTKLGMNLCSTVIDGLWGALLMTNPIFGSAYIGIRGLRIIMNSVFETDEMILQFYKLETLVHIENSVRRVLETRKDTVHEDPAGYMNAVETYQRTVLAGFKYAKDLLEVILNAPGTVVFSFITNDYNECLTQIKNIENMQAEKLQFYAAFESCVQEDYRLTYYPEFNELLDLAYGRTVIPAESISLSLIKDINIADEGLISQYIQPTLSPAGSSVNGLYQFSSSDESVLTVDSLGFFKAHSSGTITVTVKCGSLQASIEVTVGSTPTVEEPYDYAADLNYTVNADKTSVTITKYTGTQSRVIIPYYLDGYVVTDIGNSAFQKCNSLQAVIIPDSVTGIGEYAFSDCTKLASVTISDSVTSIGCDTFSNTALYNDAANWENNILYIGNHLIKAKTSLSGKCVIQAGTKTIADRAFRLCTSLTSITIPEGVTSIGPHAFHSCANLKTVTIPDSVTSIGEAAFYAGDSLTSFEVGANNPAYCAVNGVLFNKDKTTLICYPRQKVPTSYAIPDSVTSIGYGAFYYCDSLKSVTIPDGVTSIGDAAFRFCYSLRTMIIPDSVTSIGDLAFTYCRSLTSVTYCGTPEQWNAISIGSNNTYLTGATRTYHRWQATTCTAPKTCTICGETVGEPSGHSWQEATCTTSKTCTACGVINGEPLGHTWQELTCTSSKTCTACGETEIVAPGHSWSGTSCSVCNHTHVDADGDNFVTLDDAVYLLYHTMLPEEYPLGSVTDVNGDGNTDADDAIYLLYALLLPEQYPLF